MTSSTCSIPERVVAAIAVFVLAMVGARCAGEGRVVVEKAWARPAAAGGPGVVYVVIRNGTSTPERLIGASSDVCDSVELHRTEVVDDRMTMRHLAEGVPIGAGEEVAFTPGGLHVMLLGLRQPLEVGARFDLALAFEHAGVRPVVVEVRTGEKPR